MDKEKHRYESKMELTDGSRVDDYDAPNAARLCDDPRGKPAAERRRPYPARSCRASGRERSIRDSLLELRSRNRRRVARYPRARDPLRLVEQIAKSHINAIRSRERRFPDRALAKRRATIRR